MAVRISVVMANYNGAAYLAEALDSVVQQEFDDYEFIIVDDASTDDSCDIIADYHCRFPEKIRTIFQETNGGQGAAFNAGFARAQGELISLIDSDDVWFPNKLSRVAHSFGDPERVALHQHNLYYLKDGQVTDEAFREILAVGDYFAYSKRRKQIPQFAPSTGLTFSRRALEQVLPIPEQFRVCADGYLTRTAFCFGEVVATNAFLGAYRVHGANQTCQNPQFNSMNYINNLLIPTLNDFYRQKGIDLEFPASVYSIEAIRQLLGSFELNAGDRVLLIRCAPLDIVSQLLRELLEVHLGIFVDVLTQEEFASHFTSERVRPIIINDGPMSYESLGNETHAAIQANEYALGIVPYNTDHGGFYANVHALLDRFTTSRRFVGIGADGSLHTMWWLEE
jgi:glycosyltransferase involved in cell wall biosynthesis